MSEVERKGAHDPKNALCVVAAEALFVLLPFVVMALVQLGRGEISKFIYRPEWAIAAAALTGLSLVRFTTGLLQARIQLEILAWERVLLLFALIVIFALMPSLVVLTMVLSAGEASTYLAGAQLALFLIGLALFLGLGWTAQRLLSDEKEVESAREFTVIERSRAAGD